MADDSAKYHASRNEQISMTLNPSIGSAFELKPKIKYEKMAGSVEEASERKLAVLKDDGVSFCDQFSAKHKDLHVLDEIEKIFGKDHSYRTILTDIYEKIENASQHNKNEDSSTHFINTKLQEVCPRCCSLHQPNPKKSILMKTLSVYEQARLSKKACLSFATKHAGKIVQISLLVPCPQCCQKSLPEDIDIKTSPCLEGEYFRKDLLLVEQPKEFVEQSIWKWIDEHK